MRGFIVPYERCQLRERERDWVPIAFFTIELLRLSIEKELHISIRKLILAKLGISR